MRLVPGGRFAAMLPTAAIVCAIAWAATAWATGAMAADPPSLDALRTLALELINEDRRRHDLTRLQANQALAAAAQRHAEDMLVRGYFAHESPEGGTVLDRFVAAGGSRWRKVAENIAYCVECGSPATFEDVRRFHEGWMDSKTHRANILDPGLRSFGFGIAAEDGRQYAVQTFAGPGRPPALESGREAEALPAAAERVDSALALINEKRRNADVPPLAASAALTTAAETLLQRVTDEAGPASPHVGGEALLGALPEGQRRSWRELAAIAGLCGGCGVQPTRADLRFFIGQWMDDPKYRTRLLGSGFTHFGFALAADGRGRKTALALFGRRRPL